jgi:hypothetical protein
MQRRISLGHVQDYLLPTTTGAGAMILHFETPRRSRRSDLEGVGETLHEHAGVP